MSERVACGRCGDFVDANVAGYSDDGVLVCKRCEAKQTIATGDARAVTGIAGMGYAALATGLLSLCLNFYFLLSILAVLGGIGYFSTILRHPEYRAQMGWQLPASAIAAGLGIAFGLFIPATLLLAIVAGIATH